MEHNSAEYLHVLIEALRFVPAIVSTPSSLIIESTRLAFAGRGPYSPPEFVIHHALDTQWFVADPEVQPVPVEKLLSKVRLLPNVPANSDIDLRSTSLPEQNLLTRSRRTPKSFMLGYSRSQRTLENLHFFLGKSRKLLGHCVLHRSGFFVHLNMKLHSKIVSDQWGNACSYIQSNYAGGS